MRRNKQMLDWSWNYISIPMRIGSCREPGESWHPTLNQNSVTLVDPSNIPDSLAELVKLSPVILTGTCEGELPGRFSIKDNSTSGIVTDRLLRVAVVWKGSIAIQSQIGIRKWAER